MFINREEFIERLKEAPDPKEVKQQFLEDLEENKKTIMSFREELGKTLRARSVTPNLEDSAFYQNHVKKGQGVLDHLVDITDKFVEITNQFAQNSKNLQEQANTFTRFK